MFRKCFPLAVALGFLAGSAFAQNVGKNWGTHYPGGLNESETNPSIEYRIADEWAGSPATMFRNYNVPSYTEDVKLTAGQTTPFFVNDRVDDLGQFTRTFFRGVGIDPPKVFRHQPPTVTQDGQQLLRAGWTIFPEQKDGVNPSLGADLYREDQDTDSGGIKRRRQTFTWVNRDLEGVIFEIQTFSFPTIPIQPDLRVGERGAAPTAEIAQLNPMLEDFYIGWHWYWGASDRGPSGGTFQTPEPGDQSRWLTAGFGQVGLWDEVNYWDDTRKLMYSHDGDATDADGYRADGDDRGEPAPGPGAVLDGAAETGVSAGEFLETHYKARIFLHLDKEPVTDETVLSDNWLDDNNESDLEMRQPHVADVVPDAGWTATSGSDLRTVWDFYTKPNTTRDERIFVSDPDQPGWVNSSSRFQEWMTVFGPWQLEPGQSIHLVSAYIVDGPDMAANKAWGKQWQEGTITFAEKEAFLDSGFDSLNAAIAATQAAWDNRNVIPDVGIQPVGEVAPAWPPSVTVESGPDLNKLSWTASPDAVSYTIYRMEGFETRPRERFAADQITPQGPIATGITGLSYDDTDVVRGTRYFYSVVAVDADGDESAFFATRTETGVSPFKAPSNQLASIRVVPNPFQIQGGDLSAGGFNFSGQPHKLLFVNLPASAIIRIFSVTGDLIQELNHTAGSGDFSWDLMISDNNQFITSGIYFAHITSTDPTVPGTHIEKFVVVR